MSWIGVSSSNGSQPATPPATVCATERVGGQVDAGAAAIGAGTAGAAVAVGGSRVAAASGALPRLHDTRPRTASARDDSGKRMRIALCRDSVRRRDQELLDLAVGH